jgi:hypothetical protein
VRGATPTTTSTANNSSGSPASKAVAEATEADDEQAGECNGEDQAGQQASTELLESGPRRGGPSVFSLSMPMAPSALSDLRPRQQQLSMIQQGEATEGDGGEGVGSWGAAKATAGGSPASQPSVQLTSLVQAKSATSMTALVTPAPPTSDGGGVGGGVAKPSGAEMPAELHYS